MAMIKAPSDAMQVKVTGQKWSWSMRYPEGFQTGGQGAEFHLPVGKPIQFKIISTDVLHSFFVPNFRIKMDAIPGRYTTIWAEATQPGEYPIFCTEYCGTDHSNMLAKIIVEPEEQYRAWVEKQTKVEISAESGKKLFEQRCVACHSVDGSAKIGPSFKGLMGRDEKLQDGNTVKVDENYVTESIINPMAKVVQAFLQQCLPLRGSFVKKRSTV
jgi:cytochrome c oxidase subunit 2